MRYPITNHVLRRLLARRDICPECGGALDTGFECNACEYDAKYEATCKLMAPVHSGFFIVAGNRPEVKKAVRP